MIRIFESEVHSFENDDTANVAYIHNMASNESVSDHGKCGIILKLPTVGVHL